mmetsp:Transcript_39776/g.104007  ORF Transcript_39776/g.104007 Transcript_39776/m.104007 type:complete len:481 (-) Transcript_39776:45-1487(-)
MHLLHGDALQQKEQLLPAHRPPGGQLLGREGDPSGRPPGGGLPGFGVLVQKGADHLVLGLNQIHMRGVKIHVPPLAQAVIKFEEVGLARGEAQRGPYHTEGHQQPVQDRRLVAAGEEGQHHGQHAGGSTGSVPEVTHNEGLHHIPTRGVDRQPQQLPRRVEHRVRHRVVRRPRQDQVHRRRRRSRNPPEHAHADGQEAHALDHPKIPEEEPLDDQQGKHGAGLRALNQPQAPPHFRLLVSSHPRHLGKIHHLPRHSGQKLKCTNEPVVRAVEHQGGNHRRHRGGLGGGAPRLRSRAQASGHREPQGQVRHVNQRDHDQHPHDVARREIEGVQLGQHHKPHHEVRHQVPHGDDPKRSLGLLHIKEPPADLPEHLVHQGEGHVHEDEVDAHGHHRGDVEEEFQTQDREAQGHLKIHTHPSNPHPPRHRGDRSTQRRRHQAHHQGGRIDVLRGEVGQKQAVSCGNGQADPGGLPQQRHREERN